MRNFHNFIKALFIKRTVEKLKKPVNLFDISVGRMGDYHSWNKADIKYVFGVDPDVESINEAKKRLVEIKKKYFNKTAVNLAVGKITDEFFDVKFNRTHTFDIVSCQFTIHYFFENQQMFDNALYRIAYSLKSGCYFIGTTIDGEKLNKQLIEHGGEIEKENYYKITQNYKKFTEPFGNKYKFELYDIDRSGLYFKKESVEYLVSKKVLIGACEYFGMECVEIKDFKDWGKEKYFEMSDQEREISHLYFSFMFKKK